MQRESHFCEIIELQHVSKAKDVTTYQFAIWFICQFHPYVMSRN